MSRTVWRLFTQDEYWNFGRNESWFMAMAQKGLHLKHIGRLAAYFEKGEPASTQYRIDVLYEEPSQEQLEFYKEYGWTFVASYKNFYVFSSPEESSWPDLHTDPVEQGLTLTNLNKKLRNSLIISCLSIVLYLVMMYFTVFLDETPYLTMVEGDLFRQVLATIVLIYLFYTEIRNFLSVRSLRKSLLAGKPLNHRQKWRKSRILSGAVSILLFAATVYTIIIPFVGIIKSKYYDIPDSTPALPVARLAYIEQDPAMKKDRSIIYRGVDAGNRVNYDWSLIAPVQYDVMEMGQIEGVAWEGSNIYSPSVYTKYYELTFKSMAEGLLRDLMKKRLGRPRSKPVKIESSEFDSLYIAEDGTRKEIFAHRGNIVIHVNYNGSREAEQIIYCMIEAFQSAASFRTPVKPIS